MTLKNKLIHGNCIEFMRALPHKTFNHVITDIPYGVVNRDDNGLRTFDKQNADILEFSIQEFVHLVTEVVQNKIFIFCASEQVSEIVSILEDKKFETTLAIWEKTNPSPANGQHLWLSGIECCVIGQYDVLEDSMNSPIWRFSSGRSKFHPTEKPLSLLEHIIVKYTDKGDFIYDPCSGSSSTLEAAAIHGRLYCGTELCEDYFNYGINRLSKYNN